MTERGIPESRPPETFTVQSIYELRRRIVELEEALREIADPESDTSEARRLARRALAQPDAEEA